MFYLAIGTEGDGVECDEEEVDEGDFMIVEGSSDSEDEDEDVTEQKVRVWEDVKEMMGGWEDEEEMI